MIEEELITTSELKTMLDNTTSKYLVSQSMGIYMMVENNGEITEITFSYVLNGFKLVSLEFIAKSNSDYYSAYVYEGFQYVTVNNTKTKKAITSSLEASLITEYSFMNMTEELFLVFTDDLLNSLEVKEDVNGRAKLELNKDKHISNDTAIPTIETYITYENDEILKIDYYWNKSNENNQRILLEFKGLEDIKINIPSDLGTYKDWGIK